MRTTLLVLAIVACLTCAIPVSASDCAMLGTWGDRGVVSDYALAGNTLYAADGRGVTIYDVTNPAAIRQGFVARTDSPSRKVALAGDQLFVLTDKSLDVFAITGDSLSFLSRAATADTQLAVSGTTVLTAGKSLHLWRMSGNQLSATAEVRLTAPSDALLVDGSTVYASQHEAAVAMFEITASGLTRGATIPIAALDMVAVNDHLYAATGGTGLQVVDVTNHTAPVVVATLLSGESILNSVAYNGSTLFAVDTMNGSRVLAFSLDDPAAPSQTGTITEPVRAIAAGGDLLFVSGFLHGGWSITAESGAPVRVFDVSNPAAMTLAGEFVDRSGPLGGAATDGHYAYVADPPLFRVIAIDSPSRPTEVARIPIDDFSDRVRLFGNLAIVYGITSAHIVDVADPNHPRYLGVYHSPGGYPPNDVAMAGPYLLEVNHAAGFHVLDITTDPASPFHMTGLKNDGWGEFYGVTALPNSAYGIVQRGVKVVDLSDEHHAVVARVLQARHIIDAEVAPATAAHPDLLVLIDDLTLEIYSLTDPLNPGLLSTLRLPESLQLAIDGDSLYVMTAANELLRIDISDAAHPVVTNTATGFEKPTQTAVGGGRIVVADTYNLKILNDLGPVLPTPPALPVLSLEGRSTPRSVTLTWTMPAAAYDVQVSADEAFTSPEQLTVRSNRVSVALDGVRYARVRVNANYGSCAPDPWSNTLKIDPASFGRVMFADRGSRVVVRKGTSSVTVPVTVSNTSGSDVTATIRQAFSGYSQNVTLIAGKNVTADIVINATNAGSVMLDLVDNSTVIDSHEVRIDVVDPQTVTSPAGDFLVIPGVAAAKGREETNWKSDLSILCRSTSPCAPRIDFVPFNAAQHQSLTLAMQPGEVVQLPDVVRSIFDNDAASGTIEIRAADLSSLVASATTYNDSPSGRFGQRIAGHRVTASDSSSLRRQLLGVTTDVASRTNVGLLNTSDASETVHLHLYQPDASMIARELTLAPHASVQVAATDLMHVDGIHSGWIDVDTPNAVVAYASRVDQRTGDATFSYAINSGTDAAPAGFPAYVKVFDAVSSSMGEVGSVWRTAIQLVNPNAHEVLATLTLIPGSDPSQAVSKSVEIPPNGAIASESVFGDLFENVPPALTSIASLRVTSSSPLAGWARIYNTTAAGTYGQYVPLRDASPSRIAAGVPPSPIGKMALPENERLPVMAPLAADAARRTNVGLTEVAGKGAIVQLNVYDAAGSLAATKELYIPALGAVLAQRVLDTLGLTGLTGMRVELQPVAGEGVVHAYASVVENATGDAVFIPME